MLGGQTPTGMSDGRARRALTPSTTHCAAALRKTGGKSRNPRTRAASLRKWDPLEVCPRCVQGGGPRHVPVRTPTSSRGPPSGPRGAESGRAVAKAASAPASPRGCARKTRQKQALPAQKHALPAQKHALNRRVSSLCFCCPLLNAHRSSHSKMRNTMGEGRTESVGLADANCSL